MTISLLRFLLCGFACATGLNWALAADDYRSLSVPWSDKTPVALGTSIDIDLINQTRYTCLTNKPEDEKWLDGAGAVSTTVTVELVTNYQSLSKTLNLETDYKSKADINFEAVKAGGNLDLNLKYDTFAKDENRTLALVVKAQSNFGRRGLTQYKLDDKFVKLIAMGNYDEFRTACGTHTVVAQSNQAMVAVVIQLSDTSSQTKQTIESTYKSTFGASGTVSGVGVSGSAEMQAKWKSVVEAAKRLGTMRVIFESKGGVGLSDGLKLAISSNPENIDTILAALGSVGASFTQEKAAPVNYLLVSNSVFGAKTKVADVSKLDTLNTYYLQLARIDSALSRISGYQTTFPAVWDLYATSPDVLKLRSYRGQVIAAVEDCVLRDVCIYSPPQELGVLFAEDILSSPDVTLQCSYTRYESQDGKVKLNVLNNAAVILRANARLTDYVGLPTALLTRVGPESTPARKMVTTWQAFRLDSAITDGKRRVFAQIDNQIFRPSIQVGVGSVTILNEIEMEATLANMLSSLYVVNMQAQNGFFIQNAVGPAFGGACPLKQVAL